MSGSGIGWSGKTTEGSMEGLLEVAIGSFGAIIGSKITLEVSIGITWIGSAGTTLEGSIGFIGWEGMESACAENASPNISGIAQKKSKYFFIDKKVKN